MEGARVRRLEGRDIDSAIALTNLENWGYTRADFRRLLELEPTGCFAAEWAGDVVGVLTTTTYDALAFLGAVIVRPELRGKGIGQAMMEAALDALRGRGVRTVRLYAYLRAIPFYERLGFRREYEIVRWHGAATTGRLGIVRPVLRSDLDGIVRLDTPWFGASRRRLFERLLEEFPSTFLVAESRGTVRGFIVGNPSGPSCEVGPWIVDPERGDLAADLFHGLVTAAGVSEVALSGPTPNEPLLEFVRRQGFSEAFRSVRMAWGSDEFGGDPRGTWSVAGLEKG